MAELHRLRLFADDGVTVAAEFSTDPEHDRPYIVVPESGGFAAQEIEFAQGRAKIGSAVIEVVDVPTDPDDQDTGYLTSLLARGDGHTARIARRAEWTVLINGDYENVLSGVIDSVELHDSMSSFLITIADERENERRTRAFVRATTSSIWPRGVVDGWGALPEGGFLIPPTEPVRMLYGEYTESWMEYSLTNCVFELVRMPGQKDGQYLPTPDLILTDRMMQALGYVDQGGLRSRARILWREVGTSTWHVIEAPPFSLVTPLEPLHGVWIQNERATDVSFLAKFGFQGQAGQDRPTNGATVEVILGYAGEPTEDYPLHLETTFGQLLKDLYDGVYSDDEAGPTVRYDAVAVAALTEPLLARITKPLDSDDGIWKWVESQIYAPIGAAPTLDAEGEISPVRYALPDEDEDLIQLDDTNCEPLAGWSHTGSDAVNLVEITYPRFYAVPADVDPLGTRSKGDGIAIREITVRHINAESMALLGERPLKLKAETLGAIGGMDGEALSAGVVDEFGAQLAKKRAVESMDRFLFGGQHFAVRALRESTGTVRPGQWCVVACSWMPNYGTGTRGANRLAQIVRVLPLDSEAYELELVDAGPDNQPVDQPTLDAESAVVNADGSVTFNITAIPEDTEARIDYAINPTMPDNNDPLWRFAARTANTGPVSTPPNPAGGTIWIRGRGEKEGRRPSAWTIPFGVNIPETPRVRMARVNLDRRGLVTVTYIPNDYALGVRIYYHVHGPRTSPTYTLYQDFAATGTNVLADVRVRPGEVIDVAIEGWSEWDGAALGGVAGPRAYARAALAPNANSLGLAKFGKRKQTPENVTVGGIPGALVDIVLVYVKDYIEPLEGEELTIPEIDTAVDVPLTALDPAVVDEGGYVTYTFDRPERGIERYTWFIPVSADAEEGPTYMLRIDRATAGEAPFFDRMKQVGLSSTVDVFGRVNDPDDDEGGGTLSLWSTGSDFSGDPDGTFVIEKTDMPYSFGPFTNFAGTPGGFLLDNLPAPRNESAQIALKFDTADGRTTGQVIIPLKLDLSGVINEYGELTVNSWLDAMELATGADQVGVGEELPEDGDVYTQWYIPSEKKIYGWDGDSWEVQEGTNKIVVSELIVGEAVFGAINAQAVAAGMIKTKLLEVDEQLNAEHLNIGSLSLISSNAGAILHGVIHNEDNTAGIDLDAEDDEPVFYHEGMQLLANGDAIFAGDLDAAGGSFEGQVVLRRLLGETDFANGLALIDENNLASGYLEGYAPDATNGGLVLGAAAATLFLYGYFPNAPTDYITGFESNAALFADNITISGEAVGIAASDELFIDGLDVKGIGVGAADSGGAGFKMLRIPN